MTKPPFTAKSGLSGTWIEDADGVTVADINSLIDPEIALDLAELLADGANFLTERREHAKRIAKKAGRPRKKRPSAELIKRRERYKPKTGE